MLYDGRDRTEVRNAALAVTAVAWAAWIWTAREMGTPGHAHGAGAASARGAANWLLMLAAMMTPVLIEPIQFVRGQGLARRRDRATLLFVAGYASIWAAGGAVLFSLAAVVPHTLASVVTAAALALGALWQCSPAKQVCLNRCHLRVALPAFGRRADLGALGFGARHAVWCMGSCWAWMLAAMSVPGWHVAAMMAAALVMFCERFEQPATPGWRWRGIGTAMRIVAGQMRMSRSAGRWVRARRCGRPERGTS